MTDPVVGVRWNVLQFLSKASKELLEAGIPYMTKEYIDLLTWLLHSHEHTFDSQEILSRIDDADPLVRKIAVAAAVRRGHFDLVPLKTAAASKDPDISSFAREEIEFHQHYS